MEKRALHWLAGGRGVVLAALMAASLSGCFNDPTEVVIVVDTDARPFLDFMQIGFTFNGGLGQSGFASAGTLPATIGVTPQNGRTTFDVLVSLDVTMNFFGNTPMAPPPFATRKAAHVPFEPGEMRVLFIPILKACACLDATGSPSTNCEHALDPGCQDINQPQLGDFDDDNIPHLSAAAKMSATPSGTR